MNLRPMTMDDADKMLEWKNYPETRQFAIISHDEIKRDDHLKWLEDNVRYFQIIEVFDINLSPQPVGAIRVQDGEISIWVDKSYRRRGMATEAIKRVGEWGMIAKIVNGNIGSMRAFIEAGFLPIKYVDNYYILQK